MRIEHHRLPDDVWREPKKKKTGKRTWPIRTTFLQAQRIGEKTRARIQREWEASLLASAERKKKRRQQPQNVSYQGFLQELEAHRRFVREEELRHAADFWND